MAEQKRDQDSAGPSDATPYAPTKAPETQAAAEERVSPTDPRAIPGGAQGARAEIGMSAMDRADVPSGAEKPDQLDVRDTPEGVE
jgi:hypothetical protein